MNTLLHHAALAMPLFSLVFVGYALMRFSGWPKAMSESLSQFVFSVAIPAMLCAELGLYPYDAPLGLHGVGAKVAVALGQITEDLAV